MDKNNKYCACTGTDAMFHIKLNQQGPEGKQGPQGIKGTDGISPSITVEDSTDDNYQLRVTTAYNTFVTPNLKGDTKVLIDPYTLTKPGDIPEFGLNKTVTDSDIVDGVVTIPGGLGFSININDNVQATHSIKPQYRFPITTTITQYGMIIGKSTSYLLTNYSITANDPIILTRNKDGSVTLDFDDTNYQHKLTAGNNINITNNTISVTGMPTKVSELTNDAGYLTSIPSEYVTDSELAAKDYVTNTELDNKGYVTNAELSTVEEQVTTVQSDITELRETKNDNIFDIGKFAAVGSLTITDDGIASGFTTSSYLATKYFIIGQLSGKSWTIHNKFYADLNEVPSYSNDTNDIINLSQSYHNYGYMGMNKSNSRIMITTGVTGSSQAFYNEHKVAQSGWVEQELSFDIITGAYTFKHLVPGDSNWHTYTWVATTENKELLRINVAPTDKIRIGRGLDTIIGYDSVDLKQFSITVDGKEVFNGLMESTKPIYDKITTTNSTLSTFEADTTNNFSAVNSALNEKANLSDLSGYVTLTTYNALLARVEALETGINGGNA